MKLNHIKGLLVQEFWITVQSFEVILDIGLFPTMSVVLFGFLARYLIGAATGQVAFALITAILLWQIIFIVQYSVSVGSLWNIWSRNLTNMFICPITVSEYILSYAVSGIIKALFIFLLSAIVSNTVFHFNIFELGILNLLLYLVNLILFALSLGIIILGLIFRFGVRIQAFAWGLLPIFQPLTAAFYPVTVLPSSLQFLARLMAPTYVFEALRAHVANPGVIYWNLLTTSFGINVVSFIFAIIFFNIMFNKSKETGQFARLES